jgi:phenylpyruvate tautomerase PptA (4-oxalocrotonate tautomerase family)
MPFIDARFSTPVDKAKEEVIKSRLGKTMSLIGKSEAYLMVQIQSDCTLYFKGNNDEDSAFFEVKLLGKSTKENYEAVTKALCEIASEELGISGSRVYVKFEEVEYWGFDSFMF